MKFAVISVVLMLRIFQIFGGPPDRENTSKPPEKIRISDTLAAPGVLSADTLVRMGRSCEERLEYTKAYHYYTLAYRSGDADPQLILQRARMAEREGDIPLTRSLLDSLLIRDPASFPGHYLLAGLDFNSERYHVALTRYQSLLDDNPSSVLLERIGDCYLRLQSNDSALYFYNKLFVVNPRNTGVAQKLIGLLGSDPSNRLRCTEALGICDSVLRYDPGHRAVLRNKGALLFNLDLYDPAAEVYRQLLGQGDTILTNLLNLGLICNMNRAYGESAALLERARQIDSTDVGVLLTLSASYNALKQRSKAMELTRSAERTLNPVTIAILRCRGDIHRDAGEREAAAQQYYTAWRLAPLRIDLLSEILALYPPLQPQNREIALFALVNYLDYAAVQRIDIRKLRGFRQTLQSYREDLFYTGKDYLVMSTPDGQKSRLSRQRLDELLKLYE